VITLYTQTTPNGRKPIILMEEIGADYDLRFVDFSALEQKSPVFLKLNPNGKIPVLLDPEGPGGGEHVVFESAAILIYLADKFASPLWPSDPVARSICLQWLMFQMASVGPMLGQAGYFVRSAPEPMPHAIERFQSEVGRIFGVLETRLTEAAFLSDDYSIADIATYPWVAMGSGFADIDLEPYPSLRRWIDAVASRPAVERGMTISKA
jgi:GSH-dependent disulfide-bond oxidoreductase